MCVVNCQAQNRHLVNLWDLGIDMVQSKAAAHGVQTPWHMRSQTMDATSCFPEFSRT